MKTLALVIGNNNYAGTSKLENAVNDARSISEIFKKLGYDVIYSENSTSIEDASSLSEFDERIVNYDASIFYFAGHGFQFDGENYLASIECPVENPDKFICGKTCIRLTEITDIIKKAPTKVNIIIIDACRKSFGRGASTSFTQINAPEGSIIAFSTSPGEGAKDAGMEGHSMYTGVLLKYIGRELLSVEELFKKVRKTLYNLSKGSQTSWEHTSLVGDFYFNTGHMVYSVNIPYDESVVKDRTWVSKGDIGDDIISDLKTCNWNHQNPAMSKFDGIPADKLDKNKQFIIGRNILQSSGYAHNATNFIEDLASSLTKYNDDGDNHILNGILFEIYFDNNGDFRRGKLKAHNIDEIFKLRHLDEYETSFTFISQVLDPYKNDLFYIPTKVDKIIDVDVLAEQSEITGFLGEKEEVQLIKTITVLDKDITKQMSLSCQTGTNSLYLMKRLKDFLVAPQELININENIEIKKLAFDYIEDEAFDF
jgi:hypothetical protein